MSALTNGRFTLPIPLLYVEEHFPQRERKVNRPKRPRKMRRAPKDWR